MGTFSVEISIGDGQRERWITQSATVDTGAFVTSVPASLLHELGVELVMRQNFRFAHGEVRNMEIGRTWVRLQGLEIVTYVLFNEEGTSPLLGSLALEEAFLGVDPVAQRLVPLESVLI